MRRLGSLIFGGALFLAFGCNSLLENEPGRLDRGASAGGGAASDDGANGDAEPIRGDAPDGGEQAPPSSSGTNGTSGSSSGDGAPLDAGSGDAGCGVGQKACGGLCVSAEDPFFGCASSLVCTRCEVANATAACLAGVCGVGTCVPGFADCNALPADGCETNLATANDCGGCGLKCPTLKNVEMACISGTCSGTCLAGFGDCNGKVEDGCEKNLLKDKNNCGACGTRCLFGRCEQGACVF